MIDFSLSDEEQMMRDTVRAFMEKEVIPLEPQVLRNEREHRPGLSPEQAQDLQQKAKAAKEAGEGGEAVGKMDGLGRWNVCGGDFTKWGNPSLQAGL